MPRILLVVLFTLVLEGGGYSIDAFSDPTGALSKFKLNSYDLLVMA
ncbi:MAG TPA: hypothetical protein VF884_13355 [Nitrososphaeraceae archaeon]